MVLNNCFTLCKILFFLFPFHFLLYQFPFFNCIFLFQQIWDSEEYLGPSQIYTMDFFFCKNSWRLSVNNCFLKTLHLKCLAGFWIRLWATRVFFRVGSWEELNSFAHENFHFRSVGRPINPSSATSLFL